MLIFVLEILEIFHVKDHKTYGTHGSAKCILKKKEAVAIEAYVKNIR